MNKKYYRIARLVGVIIYSILLLFSGLVLLEGDTYVYFEEELMGMLFSISILGVVVGWILSKKYSKDKLIKRGIYISLGNIIIILIYWMLFGIRII